MSEPTPTAKAWRDVLIAVRDLLRTQMSAGDSLELAKECIVGLHAEDASYKSSGLYVVPRSVAIDEDETNAFHHEFKLSVIVQRRSLRLDNDREEVPSFELVDMLGAIVDLVQDNRTIELAGDNTGTLSILQDGDSVPFDIILLSSGLAYRGEVKLVASMDVYTP